MIEHELCPCCGDDPRLNSADVSVYLPCDCPICRDHSSRWFMCRKIRERYVATYTVPACDARPLRTAIEEVRALHPTDVLVY